MKKILSLILALALLFALSSCGDNDSVSSEDTMSNVQSVESEPVDDTSSDTSSKVSDDVSSTVSKNTPLKVKDTDIKIFEKMLNNHSWSYTAPFDSKKVSYEDVVENYLFSPNTFFGMYNNFWKIPNGTKPTITDPDNKYFVYYALDADKADWVIQNVFGLKPDHKKKSKRFYYSDNTLYIGGELADGESPREYEVIDWVNLGDGTTGIAVLSYYIFDDDDSEISYESPNISYFIGELKNDDKMGKYWAIKKFSNTEQIFKPAKKTKIDTFNAYSDLMYKKQMSALDEYAEYMDTINIPTYALYDIDGNGVNELIIRTGMSEAEFEFEFYTYVKGLKSLGTEGAGHTSLVIPNDKKGLETFYAQMGWGGLNKITIKDKKIKSENIFEKDYGETPYEEYNVIDEYYVGNVKELIDKTF